MGYVSIYTPEVVYLGKTQTISMTYNTSISKKRKTHKKKIKKPY